MLKTNEKKLVKLSVVGEVSSPVFGGMPYRISAVTGKPVVLPGTGGVTYNIRVGDPAVGWEGDHTEPGASIKNMDKGGAVPDAANNGLNVLSCVGNDATVLTGAAKGRRGTVTGKHGGIEHVIVDFDFKTLDRMTVGDKVLVKSHGVGLKLLDYPDVIVMNTDPRFLKAMKIRDERGSIAVPVTHTIPSTIMGSGLGATQTYSGDYDIQFFDDDVRRRHKLDTLRLGDIVAIMDADHAYGRVYRKGTVSICIVVHCNCVGAGHGPGAVTLMTSKRIKPVIDGGANLAKILKLRSDI